MSRPDSQTRPCICVFAGSGSPSDPAIMDAARKLGAKLAAAGYDLVYGGGTGGVMGEVAKAAHAAGAGITAVTLNKYAAEPQVEGANVVLVADESARFARFTTYAPAAYVALPGGPGALREAIQGLESAVYDGGPPVILVQVKQYLDGIKQYFDLALQAGMIKPDKHNCLKMWSADCRFEDALAPSALPATAPKASAPR